MALPTSRDETLVDAGPFAFNLGNSLQDQVIGGKHGSIILPLAAHLWKGDPAGNAVYNIAGHWDLDAVSARAMCAIIVPVGTTIDKIEVFGSDSAADEFTVFLQERSIASGSADPWGTAAGSVISPNSKASGITNGFVSVSWTSADTNVPFVTTAGVFYFLEAVEIAGSATGIHVFGAELTIRKL